MIGESGREAEEDPAGRGSMSMSIQGKGREDGRTDGQREGELDCVSVTATVTAAACTAPNRSKLRSDCIKTPASPFFSSLALPSRSPHRHNSVTPITINPQTISIHPISPSERPPASCSHLVKFLELSLAVL